MMKRSQADLFSGKKRHMRQDRRQLLSRRLKEVMYGKRAAIRVYSRTLQKKLWIINEALTDSSRYEGETVTLEKLAGIISNKEFRSPEVQEFRTSKIQEAKI